MTGVQFILEVVASLPRASNAHLQEHGHLFCCKDEGKGGDQSCRGAQTPFGYAFKQGNPVNSLFLSVLIVVWRGQQPRGVGVGGAMREATCIGPPIQG